MKTEEMPPDWLLHAINESILFWYQKGAYQQVLENVEKGLLVLKTETDISTEITTVNFNSIEKLRLNEPLRALLKGKPSIKFFSFIFLQYLRLASFRKLNQSDSLISAFSTFEKAVNARPSFEHYMLLSIVCGWLNRTQKVNLYLEKAINLVDKRKDQ